MAVRKRMTESDFISSIDCNFPYQDAARARQLTEEACLISTNAAFAVVDEISRPPKGAFAEPALSTELFLLVELRLSHPLVQPILALARKIVQGKTVSVSESLFVLRQVERFPGELAALSVAYFACDDIDGVADTELKRIRTAWGGK
jgi:hypothetical protein